MTLNWHALTVHGDDRSAIYAEWVPAALDRALSSATEPEKTRLLFDQAAALRVLADFAGAWRSLGRDREGRRYLYHSLCLSPFAAEVLRFRAVELVPGSVVVDDVIRCDI